MKEVGGPLFFSCAADPTNLSFHSVPTSLRDIRLRDDQIDMLQAKLGFPLVYMSLK